MSTDTFIIPPCSDVNFADSSAVKGYGHLLTSSYRKYGGFNSSTQSLELHRLRQEARKWLSMVESNIDRCDAKGIQDYLMWHNVVERFSFSRSVAADFETIWTETAMNRMAKGEKVDQVMFVRWIAQNRYNAHKRIHEKYLVWMYSTEDLWIYDAQADTPLSNHPLREALLIASHLNSRDLFAWIPDQKAFKTRLIGHFTPTLSNIDLTDSQSVLEALRTFATPLTPAIAISTSLHILHRLSTLPTTQPLDRLAYSMDWEWENAQTSL